MTASPAPIALYAARWKAFLITLLFAGFLLVDVCYYFVWPTPTVTTQPWLYQELAKTIFFIFWGLICASSVVMGLYWTLTPRPLLQLSTTSLVYRPFPRPTRTIVWGDVEHVTAVAPQNPIGVHGPLQRASPFGSRSSHIIYPPLKHSRDFNWTSIWDSSPSPPKSCSNVLIPTITCRYCAFQRSSSPCNRPHQRKKSLLARVRALLARSSDVARSSRMRAAPSAS